MDGEGYIFIPYAGRIKAAGHSPDSIRQHLTEILQVQTPDPQVQVRRSSGDGATVSVIGAVVQQGIYPIERPTRTLGAMLDRAGDPHRTRSGANHHLTGEPFGKGLVSRPL